MGSQFCQRKVLALHNLSALCCELLLSTFIVDFNQQRSWVLCRASEGLGLHVFVKVVTCICQISYTYLWFLTNGRVECSVWHLRGLGGLRVLGQSEEANPTCTLVALPPAAIFCQHHLNHLDTPESQGVWTSVCNISISRCNDCVVCYFVSELITIQPNSKWRICTILEKWSTKCTVGEIFLNRHLILFISTLGSPLLLFLITTPSLSIFFGYFFCQSLWINK